MYIYLILQITKIATIDFFEISKGLKALGYEKDKFALLLALRVVDKLLKILLSGPLRNLLFVEMLSSIANYPETIVAVRDIRQRTGWDQIN